jgi:hypothetical protein
MKKIVIKETEQIDVDSVEEVREVLMYAVESRIWSEVEDALELLNEALGYDATEEREEDSKRNQLEE